MIEIQTITIRLGEKDYTVREAGHLRAGPWNKRLLAEVKPIFEQVGQAYQSQFDTFADVLKMWPLFQQVFTDSLETVFDMLVSYSPELEADKEYIEANATERQILGGFQEVIRLADPFGIAPMLLKQAGLQTNGTLSSLPSQNGAARSKKQKHSQSVK